MTKVLVLGFGDHRAQGEGITVRSHPWEDLPRDLNVADYDSVILNFTPFETPDAGEPIDVETLPSAADFRRLLFSRGAVWAIGDPASTIGPGGSMSVQWWLPTKLHVAHRGGDQIREIGEIWSWWFEDHDGFGWHFDGSPALAEVGNLTYAVFDERALAQTRWGAALGLRFTISMIKLGGQRSGESGWITWLPRPSRWSGVDAVAALLRVVFGVQLEQPAPGWAAEYRLPRAIAATVARDARKAELEQAEAALIEAAKLVESEERFAPLLYARDASLEPIVRLALTELGATVTEPQKPGIEDARLTDPAGRTAIVEIKARSGPLKIDDVRQLIDWMGRAGASLKEGYAGKGIIVAGTGLAEGAPPSERTHLVAGPAAEMAERQGFCIVSTLQLYDALRRKQLGHFHAELFWDLVMGSVGLARLSSVAEDGGGTALKIS